MMYETTTLKEFYRIWLVTGIVPLFIFKYIAVLLLKRP